MELNEAKEQFAVVVNPGHAPNEPGAVAPDKSLQEWMWNRQCADILEGMLKEHGFNVYSARATDKSNSLTYPVKVANDLCKKYGIKNVLFVSLHCDAAPGTGWQKARGWSIWTTKDETESDILASCIFDGARANQQGRNMRTDMTDGDADMEANFYVLRNTKCPAVLIENGFVNNIDDCAWLKTETSKVLAARTIVDGLEQYVNYRISKNEKKVR